ncbi:MAG: YceI family protein, partial [Pseudoxanthomonas sp.]
MPAPPALLTRLLCLLPALALCLAAGAAPAQPRDYRLDPVHTRVLVAIDHAGFSQALGTVSGSEGSLAFDPDDWVDARVDVQIPLQKLDFGDAEWNRTVLARGLLDAGRYPLARFTSTRVVARDPGHFDVEGVLELHGRRRPLTLAVTFNQLKHHPLPPFRSTAGFSATATFSRAAFGIDAWPGVIGDQVQLRIEAEAVRGRGSGPDDAAAAGDADGPLPPPDGPATPPPPSSPPALQ